MHGYGEIGLKGLEWGKIDWLIVGGLLAVLLAFVGVVIVWNLV